MTKAPKQNMIPESLSSGVPWPDQVWVDHITGEKEIRPPLQEKYIFGNPDVPISLFRDFINDTVANHQVTVLASAPGNGKSIFNKQFFYESGMYRRIFQTQPRIVATRENARYAQSLMEQATGESQSHVIAYRTANEGDHITQSHVIREHTDGYTLQQLLSKDPNLITKDDLLIIDEAHERNPNIDMALALALKKEIRVLIQSATIDTEKFARYCSRILGGADVPIIEVPGTMYPMQEVHGGEVHEEIVKYAQMGKDNPLGIDGPLNIATLLPGAHEREEIHSRIARRVGRYTILHLHGDQSAEQQQRSFQHYSDGKIILATDILRQSVTVPDLHVMIDGGYHKIGDFYLGVKYLRTARVSRAGITQGKGRIGRTGPGLYVHGTLADYPPIPRTADGELLIDQQEIPPIQRMDPLSHYLKLLANGEEFESIDLMDVPRFDNIEHARRQAVRIGAVELNPDRLTEIGREMMELSSLDPMYARMVVESRKYGTTVELQTMAMVAACQQDGVTMTEQNSERWRLLTKENRSDMLVQLDVLAQALWMDRADLGRYNIVHQRVRRAESILRRLCKSRNFDLSDLKVPDNDERKKIIASIIAGADTLFTLSNDGRTYSSNEGFEGRLPKSTKIEGSHGRLVVGTPFTIEHYRNKQLKSHHIIKNATTVTAEQLERYAPLRCQYDDDQYHVNENGKVYKSFQVYFDGKVLYDRVNTDPEPSIETTQALINRLFLDPTPFKNASRDMKDIVNEAARLHNLLVDRSDNREYLDHIVETITTHNISKWGDIKVKEMFQLAYELRKRQLNGWLQNTLPIESHETQEILRRSPDVIPVEVEGDVIEVSVMYKENKAFLDIPLFRAASLNHDDIIEMLNGRRVYIWTDSSRKNYLTLHNAIEKSKGGNRTKRRAKKYTGSSNKSTESLKRAFVDRANSIANHQ